MINTSRKTFILFVLLWLCAAAFIIAQTPSADLDSITEDSYQRMLDRQAAERELDSLRSVTADSEVTAQDSMKSEWTYYFICGFLLVGAVLVYAYIRRTSKTKRTLKK